MTIGASAVADKAGLTLCCAAIDAIVGAAGAAVNSGGVGTAAACTAVGVASGASKGALMSFCQFSPPTAAHAERVKV